MDVSWYSVFAPLAAPPVYVLFEGLVTICVAARKRATRADPAALFQGASVDGIWELAAQVCVCARALVSSD